MKRRKTSWGRTNWRQRKGPQELKKCLSLLILLSVERSDEVTVWGVWGCWRGVKRYTLLVLESWYKIYSRGCWRGDWLEVKFLHCRQLVALLAHLEHAMSVTISRDKLTTAGKYKIQTKQKQNENQCLQKCVAILIRARIFKAVSKIWKLDISSLVENQVDSRAICAA